MYTPSPFAEHDRQVLFDFMDQHGFATLISADNAGISASHIPLLLERDVRPAGTLVGHLAEANAQSALLTGSQVLAIFHGPHAYISPRWYGAKNVVPTWNYVAVHAYGKVQVLEDQDERREVIKRLVDFYEAGNDATWSLDEPDQEYVERMLCAIVVFRIEIERLEGTWKLSQNHDVVRRERVVQALQNHGGESQRQIAQLIQRPSAQS